ncbi:carbon storage regulator CsrA [Cryobacterium sp. CG_9.6]|uniref:carbon storage regulator CsrA n=1 Tax=Cryobacterium sp. CG_9.6 TaxID=2760710 RepID=UPI00247573EC|nr:carbon storage regulator CsrA [Cryobacterium sp. CG_9.6]MDH6237252.1 carbon storage regulator [Cryobacterium sp. CG_9.6]
MLVLTRKPGEKILIGDDIVITVLDARGDSVRIGIDAPKGVKIQRDEVLRAVIEANLAATQADADAEDRIKRNLGLLGLRLTPTPVSPTPTPASAVSEETVPAVTSMERNPLK